MKTRDRGDYGRRFIEHCDARALEIASTVLEVMAEPDFPTEDRAGALRLLLSDELVHFYFKTLKFQIADPVGLAELSRVSSKVAGKRSGVARWNSSVKLRFLNWALAQNKRNPNLSKNSLAQRYADENPGLSVATLRRYLSQVPTEGVD